MSLTEIPDIFMITVLILLSLKAYERKCGINSKIVTVK